MSRPSRSERLAAKGRPKRRAAKTHFFKYQLSYNPSRVEENDLRRALQESLEEQSGKKTSNLNNSTNSSDVSKSNNSSFSNDSTGSFNIVNLKRTRSSTKSYEYANKRIKINEPTGPPKKQKCDGIRGVSVEPAELASPQMTKAIRTYSRSQPNVEPKSIVSLKSPASNHKNELGSNLSDDRREARAKISSSRSSMSRSTQTPTVIGKLASLANTVINNHKKQVDDDSSQSRVETNKIAVSDEGNGVPQVIKPPTPVQDQYLKFKRESKNYAYVKMTALKVSTSKSPSSFSRSSNFKKSSPTGATSNSITKKGKISPKASSSLNDSNFSNNDQSEKQASDKSTKIILNLNGPKSGSGNLGKKSPSNISTANFVPLNGKALDKIKITETSPKMEQSPQNGRISIPKRDNHDLSPNGTQTSKNDCSSDDTLDLSKTKNQNHVDVKVTKRHSLQGSWSLLGVPEEKVIYLRDDDLPRRLICYPAIKHVEGDVIQVRDSVLLRSGARKTDLPYIAKVCAFWEDAETGSVQMSLFWYYRPEHIEEGRKLHHLTDEIFASRHRDVDSVECIEDKCYVLTFNEYCRYRKRCKMEQVNTTWSLSDVTIPVSNESYPRRNRIPDSDVNPELVFCCRQIYDSRMKRLVRNPLINTKYGHI